MYPLTTVITQQSGAEVEYDLQYPNCGAADSEEVQGGGSKKILKYLTSKHAGHVTSLNQACSNWRGTDN